MPRFARSMRRFGAVAFSAAALAATAMAAPALGQGLDIRALFNGPGATGTAQAPAATTAAPEWSGESGSSNHPQMTAEAIRAAAANFRGCLAALWPQAERRGVTRAVFDSTVASLTPDLRIMDLLDAQPEFTKSFWDYLDILVNDDRIANGRAILAQHQAVFDAVEKAVRRRPPRHRGDLGRRIELRHDDRRSLGDPLDRDARLHRPPPGLLPRGIPLRARNPCARRRARGPSQGFVGGRLRPDPVHADLVQALRRRLRRRRPPRCGRLSARPDRLDRQQSQEGRLGHRPDLGLRGGGAQGLQLPARRPLARDDDAGMGARRHPPRRRQAVPARRGPRLSAGARRRAGAGLPHAAEFPRRS